MKNIQKDVALLFAEWLNIIAIRQGKHEWKYKGDHFTKIYTTQELFDKFTEELNLIDNGFTVTGE